MNDATPPGEQLSVQIPRNIDNEFFLSREIECRARAPNFKKKRVHSRERARPKREGRHASRRLFFLRFFLRFRSFVPANRVRLPATWPKKENAFFFLFSSAVKVSNQLRVTLGEFEKEPFQNGAVSPAPGHAGVLECMGSARRRCHACRKNRRARRATASEFFFFFSPSVAAHATSLSHSSRR